MKRLMITGAAVLLATAATAVSLGKAGGVKVSSFSNVDFSAPGGIKVGRFDKEYVETYDGEPKIVLKEMRLLPTLDKSVPNAATYMNRSNGRAGGFEARYLVLAKGITSVDYDSLKIEYIKDASGKDCSKDADGDDAWSSGRVFNSVNREAGFAEFSVSGAGDQWGKGLPQIKGEITISVADKMKTQEYAGKVSSGRIGAYKVKMEKGFMGGEKQLVLSADDGGVDDIAVFCGDKELSGCGSMTMNGVKKIMFKKPASDDIVIKVTSPDGGKTLVLPF